MTENELDNLNTNLDALSDKTFSSEEEIWNSVSACLSQFNIEAFAASEALSDMNDNELLFRVLFKKETEETDSPLFLYVVIDKDDDKYEVFATIATQQDLDNECFGN